MSTVSVEDLQNAAKASAEAAATAAVNAIAGAAPAAQQVVVHRQPHILPFEPSGDALAQGLELLDYVDQFDWSCTAAHITEAADKQSTLLSLGGKIIREINKSVRDDEVEGEDGYKKLIKKLKVKYVTVDQQQAARHQFFSAKQKAGEDFVEFYLRLKRLLEICQFANLNQNQKDELLKDILLANTSSDKIRNHCYTNHTFTLKQVYAYGSTLINIAAQTKNIKSDNHVNQVSSNNYNRCKKCGYDSRHRVCYAKDKECNKCGIKGHYGRMCQQQLQRQQFQPQRQQFQPRQQQFQPRQQPFQRFQPNNSRFQSRGRFPQRGRFQNNARFSRQVTADSELDQNAYDQDHENAQFGHAHEEANAQQQYEDDALESFSRHVSIHKL